MTQLVEEALEHTAVVKQQHAGFVVDLEPDHSGVAGVAGRDLANDSFGVELERRMGVVDLLPAAPRHSLPGSRLGGYLRIATGQPRRSGIGRRAHDDADFALVGCVQYRHKPIGVGSSFFWVPGGELGRADVW